MHRPFLVATLFAALVLLSAQSATAQERISGVGLEHMDTSIAPGDDFFMYVFGGWYATAEIPADRASSGVIRDLYEQSQVDVRSIIEDAAAGDHPAGSNEQKIGDLYASVMDVETRNRLGISPIADELARIRAIATPEDLAGWFAYADRSSLNAGAFSLGQTVDFKNSDAYMVYTYQSGIGLPDREYYFNDDSISVDIRDKYVAHIEKMFDMAGIEGGAQAAAMILAHETKVAEHHNTKEKNRDREALYNKEAVSDLDELMPRFAWDVYFEGLGIAGLDSIVVMQPDFMRAMDTIIVETSLHDWKTILAWTLLNSRSPHLTEDLERQDWEFYQKTLGGVTEQRPLWDRAVNQVNSRLGEVVGQEYVARHFPPAAKERMQELIANLRKAYEISIRNLDWMSDETKAQALDKLSKFRSKIGYPDKWRDYSALSIAADDLMGNVRRSAEFAHRRFLDRIGKPVDREEWGMTPQTLNAYYQPTLNEIVFPAAILQPPMFDMNADDAVNYGGIGSIIGHELGHGFDDQGSRFDGNGVLRNWWTDEDRAEFNARTARLIEQYNEFRPFEDLAVNGEFTQGENIGDLGGATIALLAYKLSLNGAEPPVIDGLTGYQRFFIGQAQPYRAKHREAALRQQIATDPHSPNIYRVNGVARNIPEWYEAFGVGPENKLYVAPADRVKIW